MIKVSVIVPVYKVPLEYLRACLDSLAAQTLQECDFIVVSDGAPETECSICEEYVKKDSRFKFFKRGHAGVSAARNYGIEQALGEYISFVDSDDRIDNNMLQECYEFAKKNNSDVVTMDFYETKNNIDSLKIHAPKTVDSICFLHQIVIGDIFGGMPLRIIRKKFYDKNPVIFPEHISYCEDILFWAQLLQAKPKINYLNKAFYHYVQDNNNSITRDYTDEKYKERKKFIQELKKIIPKKFKKDLNMAAFNVKMEAMSHNKLSLKDYVSFERTTLLTLIKSKQPWIVKIYLLFNTILFSIFNKSYKEYL